LNWGFISEYDPTREERSWQQRQLRVETKKDEPLLPFLRRIKDVRNDASDTELEVIVEQCDVWAHRCVNIVLFGLALDVCLAAVHPGYASRADTWGTVISNAGVWLGVWGELRFSQKSSGFQKELVKRSNDRLAAATKTAVAAFDQANAATEQAQSAQGFALVMSQAGHGLGPPPIA
jgi:hypothetical protein